MSPSSRRSNRSAARAAIATLTLAAGLSGPVFTPATGALVDAIGWRDTTRVSRPPSPCAAPVALAWVRTRPSPGARAPAAHARPVPRPRLLLFTLAAVLAYGAVEALVIHRVARFQELGFALGTVALWAGISGLLTLPGRFVLPLLSAARAPTTLLAGVIGVIAVSAALMIGGAALRPDGALVRALRPRLRRRPAAAGDRDGRVDGDEVFGAVMGVQAALIALGRAGLPALTGALHDLDDGYTTAMPLLTLCSSWPRRSSPGARERARERRCCATAVAQITRGDGSPRRSGPIPRRGAPWPGWLRLGSA